MTRANGSALTFWRPPCLLRAVIVNLKDDPTTALKGVLWATRGPWFTLRSASLLKPNVPPTPIDGDVVVHRTNVAFFQVLP
jgi:hypothetical protein